MISQGLCLLLIIHIYVHLQNHKRPPAVIYSISLAEAGQPICLQADGSLAYLKTSSDGESTTSSVTLYLKEWQKALDAHHSMK